MQNQLYHPQNFDMAEEVFTLPKRQMKSERIKYKKKRNNSKISHPNHND